jgi:hypothetical protein
VFKAFKAPLSNSLEEEEFLNKTWSYKDIFVNQDMDMLDWNVSEVRSPINGLC